MNIDMTNFQVNGATLPHQRLSAHLGRDVNRLAQALQKQQHSFVEINISDEAQQRFLQMQEGFCSEQFSEQIAERLANDLSKGETRASKLLLASDWLRGSWNEQNDGLTNLASLAGRYGDMRQYIADNFVGAEKDNLLSHLSAAFDEATDRIAEGQALQFYLHTRMAESAIRLNEQLAIQNDNVGNNPIFQHDFMQMDTDLLRIIPQIIKDSTRHFANLARLFVMENGNDSVHNGSADFASFINRATSSANVISFENWSNMIAILAEPKGGVNSLNALVALSEEVIR